jgi:hypothetical protein
VSLVAVHDWLPEVQVRAVLSVYLSVSWNVPVTVATPEGFRPW